MTKFTARGGQAAWWLRHRFLAFPFAAFLVVVCASFMSPRVTMAADVPRGIIVKYRQTGPAALDGCAETLSRRGDPFRSATRDGSASLDEIHRRFGISRHRSLIDLATPIDAASPLHSVPAPPPGAHLSVAPATRLEERRARLASRGRSAARRAADSSPSAARAAASRSDDRMAALAHVYRVAIRSGESVDAAVAALAADPHVEYAQPDHAHELDQAISFDDPFLTSEESWGQPYSDLWGAHRVGAPMVWPFADGTGSIVAVVDSGLDRFHPDIAANVWVNPGEDLNGDGIASDEDENGVDDDGNGFIDDLTGFDFANSVDADEDGRLDGPGDISDADPFDDNGHGTHVAGTIAAVGGNGLGIVGIAPGAKIMALKGFPAEGSASDSVLWRAVLYAAENGASVINTSWSCGRRCPTNPLAEEVLSIVESLGAVVVTSAGNASEDVVFRSPENTSAAITVGSTGVFDRLSSFSNLGWLVDLVAPGGGPSGTPGVRVSRRNILSLLSSGARETQLAFAVGEQYLRLAGTSMSAPHVTGAVAVLRARRPELSPRDVRHLLRLTAEDLGSSGIDPEMGAGLLDLAALVEAPMPDIRFQIAAPRAGAFHSPLSGALPIRVQATGSDLEAVEITIGRGLSPSDFVPLAEFGTSTERLQSDANGEYLLAEWDTQAVPEGPHVIRVRARLTGGRALDEFTIVAIERNAPVALSSLTLDAGRPELDGAQVYWHRDEVTDSAVTSQIHDPYSMRFPSGAWLARGFEPTPRQIYAGEGDQRNLTVDEGEIAWVVRREGINRIEHCRRPEGRAKCLPREVTQAPGAMTRPFLAKGWLTWTRSDAGENVIEGCRVDGPNGICTAIPLVRAESRGDWSLQSFDGDTLLLRNPFGVALCRLNEVKTQGCVPEPIVFPAGDAAPIEPIHFADLMVFSRASTELVWPPGCPPGVYTATCRPKAELVVQYYACALEGVPASCESIPVSGRAPINQAQGVAVSERRIVWSMGSATESAAIRFCEFDRLRRRCPAQRLGGTPAFATSPAIEGDRIVWEDSRTGPIGIWGFTLPGFPAARSVRVVAGKPFSIPVWARHGMSPSLEFELESAAGVSIAAASGRVEGLRKRARFVSTARVRGVMPADQSGTSIWILRARGEGGLSSEQRIEIQVRD